MTDEASPPHILRALDGIMNDVTAMGKDGLNRQQNFPFRSHDGVINLLGPAFRKHKVIPSVDVTWQERRQYQTKTGTAMMETRVTITYTLISLVDGSKHVVGKGIPGESADAGDKSNTKAVTVACRVALIHGFAIPTQEPDPDEESYERAAPEPLTKDQSTLMAQCKDQLTAENKKVLNDWYKSVSLPRRNDLSRDQADMVLTEMSRLLTEQTNEVPVRERPPHGLEDGGGVKLSHGVVADPETGEIIDRAEEPF